MGRFVIFASLQKPGVSDHILYGIFIRQQCWALGINTFPLYSYITKFKMTFEPWNYFLKIFVMKALLQTHHITHKKVSFWHMVLCMSSAAGWLPICKLHCQLESISFCNRGTTIILLWKQTLVSCFLWHLRSAPHIMILNHTVTYTLFHFYIFVLQEEFTEVRVCVLYGFESTIVSCLTHW